MKTILMVSLFAIAAFALAGCAPPANTNANANSNSNAASKASAPTADSLMALETKAWEAYKNKDGKYFETFLGDSMVSGNGEGSMPKADVVKMISGNKAEMKSFSLSDPHVTSAGADAAVLTYKARVEGTEDGKAIPSPVTVATVFVRAGTDWKAVYHNEVAVIDPTKMTGDAAKKEDGAKPADDKKEATAEKKEAADDKKDMSAASEKKEPAPAAGNRNTASNSNSSATSGDAALTDALMVLEKKGWEGWKAKDGKALDEVTGKDFVFVDTMGKATMTKADAMKMWTTDNPCTVSNVSLTDSKATSITKDAAILVYKGTATGTCGDMKLEPLWGTTVFVKEGDAWKAVYIFETPIKKS
ncbi:MAG: nuclear transport factor 2 family protein [Acidobacteriota bacterium]